jgi:predicted CopG family antitoxin
MSKQIRLDDRVYERIKSAKRDDESFSNAVERLLADRSFSDLRDVFDEEQISEMRAAIEAADEQDRQAVTETAERFK